VETPLLKLWSLRGKARVVDRLNGQAGAVLPEGVLRQVLREYSAGPTSTRWGPSLASRPQPTPSGLRAGSLPDTFRQLPPARFIDVGAGTGMFTGLVPSSGVALDQSPVMLERPRSGLPGMPVVIGRRDHRTSWIRT
jgi:hypothetical protein